MQQVMVRNDGGKISAVDGMIKVAGAKEIVICRQPPTMFNVWMIVTTSFSKEDPLDKVKAIPEEGVCKKL